MYSYIKVKNHKAIKQIKIENLGQLNVICGKNNSGKTSILEALQEEKCFAIGKSIKGNEEWLKELYEVEAKRYSTPSPRITINGFNQFIDRIVEQDYVLYQDEIEKISKMLNEFSEPASRVVGEIFIKFFEKTKRNYMPFLIPSKRTLESKAEIQTDLEAQSDGKGIINRLFHLKNQDFESSDYKIYTRIQKDFKEITGYDFKITTLGSNQITLAFKTRNSEWALAEDCGMGLSDVLIIIYHSIYGLHNILLIEEPESHLHPEMQKKLLTFMKKNKSKQYILSTHSSIFLNSFIIDRIFYSQIIDQVILSDETNKSKILQNLGYSVTENIVSDIVVLTEGPTDVPFLTKLLEINGVLDKYIINFWPLGGDIMAQINLDVFAEQKNVIAIIDNDPKSSVIRTRFVRNCKDKGIKCIRLKRYSIENYYSIESIKNVLKENFPSNLVEINPDKKLDEQLGNEKNGKIKNVTIKTKTTEIVNQMKKKDFEVPELKEIVKAIIKISSKE